MTNTNPKKFLSVEFPSEYFDTVKYYLNPDKKMLGKIRALFATYREFKDSPACLKFKRDVVAIVLKFYHHFVNSEKYHDYYPWAIDDSCLACATEVAKFVDDSYSDHSIYSCDNEF